MTGNGTFYPGVQVPVDRWKDFEDPTYMGFYFRFLPPSANDITDFDYLPEGLFLGAGGFMPPAPPTSNPTPSPTDMEHPDSAVSYLRRRNEHYRSDMLKEFRDGMFRVTQDTPWVFEKVTGLTEIWKFDPKNNYRAKDKKIVFECNESINAKMTYLIDLYRKGAYDTAYMRYMLPETQRYFSMELIVTEIRNMQSNRGFVNATFEPTTFLSFIFEFCEFDFFSGDTLSYTESLMRYPGEAAKVKIPIKIGRIRECNRYGLLDAILQDTYGIQYRNEEGSRSTFGPLSKARFAGELPIGVLAAGDIAGRKKSIVYDGDFLIEPFGIGFVDLENDRGFLGIAKFATLVKAVLQGEALPIDILQQTGNLGALGNLITGAVANLTARLETAVNARVLGNVYGLSLGDLIAQLGGILNNPIAAAQGIAASFATPEAATAGVLGGVTLSSADIDLITDIIGKAQTALNAVVGTPLESSSIGDLVGDQNEAIKNTMFSQNLEGNPGKTVLAPGQVRVEGNPGKTVLESSDATLEGNPGKTQLTSADSNLGGNPGKTVLEGSDTELEGNPGSTLLDPGSVKLEGNPGKTQLDEGSVKLEGSLSSTQLTGSDIKIEGNPGKTQLTSASSELEGRPGQTKLDPGIVKLEGNPGQIEINTGSVKLEGNPGQAQLDPGNVSIEGNPGKTQLASGQIRLEGDPGKTKLDPGNISIEGDPGKTKLDTGNVKLEGNPGKASLEQGQAKLEGNPGKTNLNTGQIKLEGNPGQAKMAGPKIVLEGNPGKATAEGADVKLEGELGKQFLAQPSIMNSTMGKIIFGDNGTSLEGSLGRVIFSAPSTKTKDPGKVALNQTKPKQSPLGTEKLEVPAVTKDPLGKEILTGAENDLIAQKPEKIGFESTPRSDDRLENIELSGAVTSQNEAGKVDLVPALVSKTDNLGSTRLEAPETKEEKMSNINLTGSPVTEVIPGSTELLQPDKISEESLGNVSLDSNRLDEDVKMGNADFTMPPPADKNSDDMQVELDAPPKPADLTQINIGLEGVGTGDDIAEGKGKPVDRKIIGGTQSNINIGNDDNESTINK